MSGSIDRQRASHLMQRAGIDALILCEPEAIEYAMNAPVGPAGLFRRAGAGFAVIPRSTDLPLGVVVADSSVAEVKASVPEAIVRSHAAWIESVSLGPANVDGPLERRVETALGSLGRPAGFTRPATFDLGAAVSKLRSLLAELGYQRGLVGIDLDFVPVTDFLMIESLLSDFSLQNGSPVLDRLRAIKSDREIGLLRCGIGFSEIGFMRISQDAVPGMRHCDLIDLYRSGVGDAAAGSDHQVSTKEYLSLGAGNKGLAEPAARGDPLKADMICSVDGYAADMSRNFVFGPPSADQARLHDVAEQAFDAGLDALRPGKKLGEVYRAVSENLSQQGMPSYCRGHFGHGVGNSVFSEQWPFIAAGSDVEIEPDMVLAFEVPLYVDGVARFNIEDQILITPAGPVSMNRMPRILGIL